MANSLSDKAKVLAMTAIKDDILTIDLKNAANETLASANATASSYAVNASTGVLSNSSAIDFTIGAEDVGETATYFIIRGTSTLALITADLTTSVALTTEGTATFAIGSLTVDL